MDPIHEEVARRMDGIEAELRRLGRWSDSPPPPEAFESDRAFFGDTMAFETWLQFVLAPRVGGICADGLEFPAGSALGAYAVRQLDGDENAGRLCSILSEFDGIVTEPPDAEELDALRTARRFLDAVARGDGAAARAELAESSRDAPSEGVPRITAYHPGRAVRDGEAFVLDVEILGESGSGPESIRLPLLLVREEGRTKVDLMGTMGRLFDRAVDDLRAPAPAEGPDPFAEARREETREAMNAFLTDRAPALEEELGGALGRPVPLCFDFTAVEEDFTGFHELARQLEDLATALRAMDASARERTAEAVTEFRVRVVPDPAAKGVRIEGGGIETVLAPSDAEGTFFWPVAARLLEIEADEDLGPRLRFAAERATAWWQYLRDQSGLPLAVEVDWQRLTGNPEPGASAWALYQVTEVGLDPVCDALSGLVAEDEAFAASARESLRRLVFEPAWGEEEPGIRREEEVVTVSIRPEEGAPRLGSPEEIRERLRALFA